MPHNRSVNNTVTFEREMQLCWVTTLNFLKIMIDLQSLLWENEGELKKLPSWE